MSYVLGIDLGTGSLKGIIFNTKGEVVGSAAADYPLINPAPGYSEQAPKDWIRACEKVMSTLSSEVPDLKCKLAGISFSGQMHSLVLLDQNYEVLRNSILWNDVRTTKQCEQIMTEFGDEILDITGNIALEGFTLPKILWVQQNEPELWDKVTHILLPKDYLRYYLTGNLHMDYSDAAGTLLFDLENKSWSTPIMDHFNIKEELLPSLLPSTGYVGTLSDEIKERFSFQKEIKVFAGGADNACSAIGAGIVNDQVALASVGTSGVFLSLDNKPLQNYQGKLHLFHHATEDDYYSMGVTLAAGNSLDWFKNTFAKNMSYNDLLDQISEISPGANGLLFTPYIVGERTPYVDSDIRGSFIGIDTSHRLEHFARAVLEGITFSLRQSQELMTEITDRQFDRIISVGGGARNQDWLEMQANIFDTPVVTLSAEEGPGAGAAMIAAVGLGWFKNFEECAEVFVNYSSPIYPSDEQVEKYNQIYDRYKQVYPATKPICLKK